MTLLSKATLELFKNTAIIVGPLLSTILSVFNTVKETRKDGKLTKWGKWSTFGVILGGVITLSTIYFDSQLSTIQNEERQNADNFNKKRIESIISGLSKSLSISEDQVGKLQKINKGLNDVDSVSSKSLTSIQDMLDPIEPMSIYISYRFVVSRSSFFYQCPSLARFIHTDPNFQRDSLNYSWGFPSDQFKHFDSGSYDFFWKLTFVIELTKDSLKKGKPNDHFWLLMPSSTDDLMNYPENYLSAKFHKDSVEIEAGKTINNLSIRDAKKCGVNRPKDMIGWFMHFGMTKQNSNSLYINYITISVGPSPHPKFNFAFGPSQIKGTQNINLISKILKNNYIIREGF